MKKYFIIGIVVAIIVLAGLATYFSYSNVGYWETETDFGIWQDELFVKYADGSVKSFKLVEDPLTLSYYFGGGEVTEAWIELSAKVTGSGYDGAVVDCQSFGYQRKAIKATNGQQVYIGPDTYKNTDYNVPLGQTKTLFSSGDTGQPFSTMIGSQPDGVYTIVWNVHGSVRYKPYPDDGTAWKDCTNPPDRSLTVQKVTQNTGQVVVTLSSGQGAD